MQNKMSDLRRHLFATLEDLRDPNTQVDYERVNQITQVSQTIINSAKVEVDFFRATGFEPSNKFFEQKQLN